MTNFYFFVLLLTTGYSGFITWCYWNWKNIPDDSDKEIKSNNVKVAVIVPVRNERHQLNYLMKSLLRQDYRLENFEIIIVDDHSTDGTFELAENYIHENKLSNISCIRNTGNFKKDAISSGVLQTKAELIITTDADITPG